MLAAGTLCALPVKAQQADRLVTLKEALELFAQHNLALRVARAEAEASQAALLHARRVRRPEPTLTAGLKRQSDGFQGVYFGAALGLPFFNRNTGQVLAETARLHAAQTREILARRQAENEVRQAYATYVSLRDRTFFIQEDLLDETDDLLQIALTSYGEGEMTLVELLDAAAAFRDARLTSLDLRAAFRTSYYDVLRAAGGPLPTSFN